MFEKLWKILSVNVLKVEFDFLVIKIWEYYERKVERMFGCYNWFYFGLLYFLVSVVIIIGMFSWKILFFVCL